MTCIILRIVFRLWIFTEMHRMRRVAESFLATLCNIGLAAGRHTILSKREMIMHSDWTKVR